MCFHASEKHLRHEGNEHFALTSEGMRLGLNPSDSLLYGLQPSSPFPRVQWAGLGKSSPRSVAKLHALLAYGEWAYYYQIIQTGEVARLARAMPDQAKECAPFLCHSSFVAPILNAPISREVNLFNPEQLELYIWGMRASA